MAEQKEYLQKIKTRALICRDKEFLCIKKVTDEHEYYTLPGGTLEEGEEPERALKRECVEEIDAKIEVLTLIAQLEHNITYVPEPELDKHKVEYIYLAHVGADYIPHVGHLPDPEHVDVFWMSFDEAKNHCFLPPQLPELLVNL